MYRKLNVPICSAAILLILSLISAEKSGQNNWDEVLIPAYQVKFSDQKSIAAKVKQLQKSLSGKFCPDIFSSGFSPKSTVKEFVQKSKVVAKKGWKNKRIRTILAFLSVLAAGTLVLIRYYRKLGKVNRFMTTTRLSVMNRFVRQACRYIEKNYADTGLTVDQICSELVTGRAYLEALFKKELGMRVEDFIDQVRINRVKIMINKNPDLSLSEAAETTGFADEKECLARFRSICGVDFEDYRDRLHQNNGLQ